MDQTDALEDWVAVKENPFLDTGPHTKLEFLVAWNEVDWKIAVTCREKSRTVSDKESQGWSGIFRCSELKSIHEQLALVHPSLGHYLPQLPDEPRGLWSYITPVQSPCEDVCELLTLYFKYALDICGYSLLTSTLFEEHSYEEYFEHISELRRRNHDEAIARAEDELKNVLFLRSGSINMLDMAEVYKQEDQAIYKWNIAQAELYNYLIQPFLDMREMALDKLRVARAGLQNPDLGKRRKDELAAMFTEWNEHYTHALDRIQELYIEYYSKTFNMLKDVKKRMSEDKSQFGRKSFQIAALDRYNRTHEDFTLEKLQLLNNTKKHHENQRDKVKQEIASLDGRDVAKKLGSLEQDVYKWQRDIYDLQLQVSEEEERLIRNQIASLKETFVDAEDEFHDAVETEEELVKIADCQDPKVKVRLLDLQRKMTGILKKRAQLRNRKKRLDIDKTNKQQDKVEKVERFHQHHKVQLKREKEAKEVEENEDFLVEERRRTLKRLKDYKMKRLPAPPAIKPRKPQTSRGTTKRSPKPANRVNISKKVSNGDSHDHPDSAHADDTTAESVPNQAPPTPPISSWSIPASSRGSNFQMPLSPSKAPPPPGPPPSIGPPPPPGPPPSHAGPPQFIAPPPPPGPPPALSFPPPPPPSPIKNTSHTASNNQKRSQKDTTDERSKDGATETINLKDIQNARQKLKTVDDEQLQATNKVMRPDPMSDMMQLIRHGVKLRPVQRDDDADQAHPSPKHSMSPSDSQTQQLMDAIERIGIRLRTDSDDESDTEQYGDFDD